MLRKPLSQVVALPLFLLCGNMSYGGTPPDRATTLYERIAGDKALRIDIKKDSASFKDGINTWTIFGAEHVPTPSLIKDAKWSVGKKPYEVLVVNEPISNEKILPYSEPVPNIKPGKTISISAARGEYEPASMVIRSGEEPLRAVSVTVGPLTRLTGKETIGKSAIDIRVVKAWYQSGTGVGRVKNEKKVLTPELLLHDAALIEVDYDNQVNLVRNIQTLADADHLLPFKVPARSNQQIWLTVHVPQDAVPGDYAGEIFFSVKTDTNVTTATLSLNLRVLPFVLENSPLDYCLYYLSVLEPQRASGFESAWKTTEQIEMDFLDMRAHGLTDVAIAHSYRLGVDGKEDLSIAEKMLQLMRSAGFATQKFLYVDWQLNRREDPDAYGSKVAHLRDVAQSYGFKELYVYGPDEAPLDQLLAARILFQRTHQAGGKNFVTIRPEYAGEVKDLLDIGIIHRNSSPKRLKQKKISVWAYGGPQAGEETPATYRNRYGLSLWIDGFDGACNYAYQSSHNPYDDWASTKWRPHNMTYPTQGSPIPTLQWEGWREGIDDVRYLATLAKKRGLPLKAESSINLRSYLAQLLRSSNYPRDLENLRPVIIEKILD